MFKMETFPVRFLFVTLVISNMILNGVGGSWTPEEKKFLSRPYFGKADTEITVQQGEVAFFNCHVNNLDNQTVSWMRTSDGYPIFIGREKYINDDRFELISTRVGDYTLRLKFSSAEDAGKFECQVSTSPKISRTYSLTVVVPSVSVDGDTEKHVMSGSPVDLKCIISNCLKEPTYVFWYRSGSRLVEDAGGRLRVQTGVLEGGRTAVSILTIHGVRKEDDGEYTCRPASGGEATVRLHVVRGEILPAMQHDQSTGAAHHNTPTLNKLGLILLATTIYSTFLPLLTE